MFDKKIFGQRLRQLRDSRKLSQQQLADILGISNHAVSKMENGQRAASVEVVSAIAEYFQVPGDYLFNTGIFARADDLKKNMPEVEEFIIQSISQFYAVDIIEAIKSQSFEMKLLALSTFVADISIDDEKVILIYRAPFIGSHDSIKIHPS